MIICFLSFLSIFIAMLMFYDLMPYLSDPEAREMITMLSLLTMLAALLETQTRIKWLKEKKEKENSATD